MDIENNVTQDTMINKSNGNIQAGIGIGKEVEGGSNDTDGKYSTNINNNFDTSNPADPDQRRRRGIFGWGRRKRR